MILGEAPWHKRGVQGSLQEELHTACARGIPSKVPNTSSVGTECYN